MLKASGVDVLCGKSNVQFSKKSSITKHLNWGQAARLLFGAL